VGAGARQQGRHARTNCQTRSNLGQGGGKAGCCWGGGVQQPSWAQTTRRNETNVHPTSPKSKRARPAGGGGQGWGKSSKWVWHRSMAKMWAQWGVWSTTNNKSKQWGWAVSNHVNPLQTIQRNGKGVWAWGCKLANEPNRPEQQTRLLQREGGRGCCWGGVRLNANEPNREGGGGG